MFGVRHIFQQVVQQCLPALVNELAVGIAPLAVVLIQAAVRLPGGRFVLQRHPAALADEPAGRTQQRIDGNIKQPRKQLERFGIGLRFARFP